MKGFFERYKGQIVGFSVLAILTVALCVPATLYFVVKIFGWASYLYLTLGYVACILRCTKKPIQRLRPIMKLLLIFSVFFLLSTVHVVLYNRQDAVSGFITYIVSAYNGTTVGGVLLSILTSPVVVYCGYTWSVVIFLVVGSILFYFFLRPFMFVGKANPFGEKKKKTPARPPQELLSAASPVLVRLGAGCEPKPVSFNVEEPESERDRACRLLLGGPYEIPAYLGKTGKPEVYTTSSYDLRGDKKAIASVTLLGEDGSENKENFNKLEQQLGVRSREDVFGGKSREDIFDMFTGDALHTPFAEAVRQQLAKTGAPAPVTAASESASRPVFVQQETVQQPFAAVSSMPVRPTASEPVPVRPTASEPVLTERQPVVEEPIDRMATLQSFLQTENVVPTVRQDRVEQQEVRTAVADSGAGSSPSTVSTILRTETAKATAATASAPRTAPTPTLPKQKMPYVFPPIALLQDHKNPKFVDYVENYEQIREVIEVKMQNFGVYAYLRDAQKGPTLTLLFLELAEGCSYNKLKAAQKDLQRLLGAVHEINIVNAIHGTTLCGVEVANEERGTVSFKEVITSEEFRNKKGDLVVAMGKTADGRILIDDIGAMPHALIAGSTGSGKSVCVNVLLASLLYRYSPDEVKLILIDLKKVEMGVYSGLPHMLFRDPLSDPQQIVNALKWSRDVTTERYNLFTKLHIRDISEYNRLEGVEKLPRILIIIDEASELMTDNTIRKTVEATLSSLARVSRAAGVHLIFATQNPVKEVITNEIQNNLNTKIAFAVGEYTHSMIIFKAKGAENLLGKGDMIIKRGNEKMRVQGAFIHTEETKRIVEFIENNNEAEFDDEMIDGILSGKYNKDDDLLDAGNGGRQTPSSGKKGGSMRQDGMEEFEVSAWQALKICYDNQHISVSYLQRKLSKGYNTIANIMDYWENEGYVSPMGSDKSRHLLHSAEEFYAEYQARFGEIDPHLLPSQTNEGDA